MTEEQQTNREDLPEWKELQAAADEFNALNGPGKPQVQVSPWMEMEAAQNALISLLIEAGLVEELEFLKSKWTFHAQMLRATAAQAKEQQRAVFAQMLSARPGELPRNGG